MLPIEKRAPPRELAGAVRRIKGTPDAVLSWSNVDGEESSAVLRSLLEEQGFLCAYCMRRIDAADAHVEHIIPQSAGKGHDDPDSVNYGNMLAVCDGFEGTEAGLTCDRSRGNTPLTVNPLKSGALEGIRYQRDGVIRSDNAVVNKDLDETLNLNQSLLTRNRKAVVHKLDRLFIRMSKTRGNGFIRSYCDSYIKEHLADPSKREPYDGVLIYFMCKRAHAAA